LFGVAVDELPLKCVLVLGDIDAVDMTQTRKPNAKHHEADSKDTKRKASLSGDMDMLLTGMRDEAPGTGSGSARQSQRYVTFCKSINILSNKHLSNMLHQL